jgi:hypothetical protein
LDIQAESSEGVNCAPFAPVWPGLFRVRIKDELIKLGMVVEFAEVTTRH